VPGDKSTSHRALIFAALAKGTSELRGLCDCADIHATIDAICRLGAIVDFVADENGLSGTVIGAIPAPSNDPDEADFDEPLAACGIDSLFDPLELDCGNSATTARLLMGTLAGYAMAIKLTGDASLRRRPFGSLIKPLLSMGVRINRGELGCRTPCGIGADTLPLLMKGRSPLKAIKYHLPAASAQVKSAIILAGLRAEGITSVTEPAPSRDHTERLLGLFGVEVNTCGQTVSVHGGQRLHPADIKVFGDPSAAAVFAVCAALIPGSELVVPNIYLNPTRLGFVAVMRRMGADIEVVASDAAAGQDFAQGTGSLKVRYAPGLTATTVEADELPSLIDEVPILALLATQASGTTVFKGVGELRHKESNRIQGICEGLMALGVEVSATGGVGEDYVLSVSGIARARSSNIAINLSNYDDEHYDDEDIARASGFASGQTADSEKCAADRPVNEQVSTSVSGQKAACAVGAKNASLILNSHGDHRLAMAWSVAKRALFPTVEVQGLESLAVSYPDFLHDLEAAGAVR
jgi:3-phosphoshikimate 1-carboxyvinyltransferase